MPDERREQDKGKLAIRGGNVFNIKNLDVDIPLGKFVAVTGVSGSGKSSLLYEILYKNLQSRYERKKKTVEAYNCKTFTGTEYAGRAVLIDQSPIGSTPRSNPATYTGAWTHIRDLFAETSEARARGWKSNRFSFNVKGGRCEACEGNGEIAVEMHFLPTVYVSCEVCGGKRFTKDTLEVTFKGKNIWEVLNMTVEEGLKFFEDIPAVADRFKTLSEVGLEYLEIGQSATTLSGGEAQRVKISSELYRPHTQKTIYLLDEPTVGLHYEDVKETHRNFAKLGKSRQHGRCHRAQSRPYQILRLGRRYGTRGQRRRRTTRRSRHAGKRGRKSEIVHGKILEEDFGQGQKIKTAPSFAWCNARRRFSSVPVVKGFFAFF